MIITNFSPTLITVKSHTMTLAEAVDKGLITKAEVEWAYDPCDFIGFDCLSHMEYDAAMFEAQRAYEDYIEEQERSYIEEAEAYADAFFNELPF